MDGNFIIVMDANVWLDLYKLPPYAICNIIEAINGRPELFWMPHQVFVEYKRNFQRVREDAIGCFIKLNSDSEKYLKAAKNDVEQAFQNLRRNNINNAATLQEVFTDKISKLIDYMSKQIDAIHKEFKEELLCISATDIIQTLVERLNATSGCAGYKLHELLRIYSEGEIRHQMKLAPGHKDEKKGISDSDEYYIMRKYGDLLLWKQTLAYVHDKQVHLVLVQNETKKDWWASFENGQPAKILIDEFCDSTQQGSEFEMMNFDQFLSKYGETLGLQNGTTEDIIKRYQLERNICNYIETNKRTIVEKYLAIICDDSTLFDDKILSLYDDFSNIDEMWDITFDVSNTSLIRDKEEVYIKGYIHFDFTATVPIYHSWDVTEYTEYEYELTVETGLYIEFVYTNLDAPPDDAYEISDVYYIMHGLEVTEHESSFDFANDE